jgi:hypothetical protein
MSTRSRGYIWTTASGLDLFGLANSVDETSRHLDIEVGTPLRHGFEEARDQSASVSRTNRRSCARAYRRPWTTTAHPSSVMVRSLFAGRNTRHCYPTSLALFNCSVMSHRARTKVNLR